MLLRGLRWGLAGVLVAWTVLRLFGLERGWPLVPLFAFTPWVAGLALLAAIGALVFGRRLFALLTGACAVVLLVGLAPRVIPNRAPADAPGVRLRVLSANVAANPTAGQAIAALVRRYRPDIFSVIELPPEVVTAYQTAGVDEAPAPHRAARAAGLHRHRALLEDPAAARAGAGGHALRHLGRRRQPARRGAVRDPRRPPPGADLARRRRATGATTCARCRRPAPAGCGSWPATSTPRSTIPSCAT